MRKSANVLPNRLCAGTVWIVGWLIIGPTVAAERPSLECRTPWKSVLGGEFVDLKFAVRNADPAAVRLSWSFTVATETLVSGHAHFSNHEDNLAQAVVTLEPPELQPGDVLSGTLKVSLVGADNELETATIEHALSVFSPDPFISRLEWLQSLDISLFDPEYTTTGELEGGGLPFEPLDSVDEIADEAASKGLLIIGEGVDFGEHPGLAAALLLVASQGRPVLCLAPAGGSLPIPELTGSDISAALRVTFRHSDAIAALDPRLDADHWPGRNDIVASGFISRPQGQGLAAEFGPPQNRWPWLDIEYRQGHGRLIVCGFGLMRSWSEGPTPRYLLARVIEDLMKGRAPREASR
jgi:hypothetical protein